MSDADTSGLAGKADPIDPELYNRDDVRRVLAVLGIGALYRILGMRTGSGGPAGSRLVGVGAS